MVTNLLTMLHRPSHVVCCVRLFGSMVWAAGCRRGTTCGRYGLSAAAVRCSTPTPTCFLRAPLVQAEYPKSQGDILALAACVMKSEGYKKRLAAANRESKRKQYVLRLVCAHRRVPCSSLVLPRVNFRAAAAAERRMQSRDP